MLNDHVKFILGQMCTAVGADSSTIDFKENAWYTKHYWSREEQEEFRIWLFKHLMRNRQAYYALTDRTKNKKNCEQLASEFVFNYGWTTISPTEEALPEENAGLDGDIDNPGVHRRTAG